VLDQAIRIPKPKLRTTLVESADELRAFKRMATLQDAEIERPPDRPTDWAGAAKAAAELGMKKLAERLTAKA